MAILTRPPPKVLLVHDGRSPDSQVTYLRKAGLDVAKTHADDAVATALDFQPDIIVLDFDCDGETVTALKEVNETKAIPIIALAELEQPA
jgi:DNA-binding response OmpR family regulator